MLANHEVGKPRVAEMGMFTKKFSDETIPHQKIQEIGIIQEFSNFSSKFQHFKGKVYKMPTFEGNI